MNILVIADTQKAKEFKEKSKSLHDLQISYLQPDENISQELLSRYEVIFDLNFSGDKKTIAEYAQLKNRIVIAHTVTHTLTEHVGLLKNSKSFFAGINALPTFIDKPKAEISFCRTQDKTVVCNLFERMKWGFEIVADRVGMLTPRVICMIINEAFYTLQEGTASANDIDLAMKLGTNYPFGPFEWMEKIGIKNVYELLAAMYNDTHDERYKTCPLLKTVYFQSQIFE